MTGVVNGNVVGVPVNQRNIISLIPTPGCNASEKPLSTFPQMILLKESSSEIPNLFDLNYPIFFTWKIFLHFQSLLNAPSMWMIGKFFELKNFSFQFYFK